MGIGIKKAAQIILTRVQEVKPVSILTDPSENYLANAVQENLFTLFRAIARALSDSQLSETGKLSYHITSPTSPMFKAVWRTQLSEDEADAVIDETIGRFKAHKVPYLFW